MRINLNVRVTEQDLADIREYNKHLLNPRVDPNTLTKARDVAEITALAAMAAAVDDVDNTGTSL